TMRSQHIVFGPKRRCAKRPTTAPDHSPATWKKSGHAKHRSSQRLADVQKKLSASDDVVRLDGLKAGLTQKEVRSTRDAPSSTSRAIRACDDPRQVVTHDCWTPPRLDVLNHQLS